MSLRIFRKITWKGVCPFERSEEEMKKVAAKNNRIMTSWERKPESIWQIMNPCSQHHHWHIATSITMSCFTKTKTFQPLLTSQLGQSCNKPPLALVHADWLNGNQNNLSLKPWKTLVVTNKSGAVGKNNAMWPVRSTCHLYGGRHQIKHTNTLCYLHLHTASGFQYQASNRAAAFSFFSDPFINDPKWDNLLPGWITWQQSKIKAGSLI